MILRVLYLYQSSRYCESTTFCLTFPHKVVEEWSTHEEEEVAEELGQYLGVELVVHEQGQGRLQDVYQRFHGDVGAFAFAGRAEGIAIKHSGQHEVESLKKKKKP